MRDLYPPLVTDLEQIAADTMRQADDNAAFAYYIDTLCEHGDLTDAELDACVDAIAQDVAAQIDCTACANCCRGLTVGLTPEDIPPLAQALQIAPEDVVARYVAQGATPDDEWGTFRQRPCAFLAGGRCSIYAARPASCRDYPAFTPDFRWLAAPILAGAGVCPIIYNVTARLKVALGW